MAVWPSVERGGFLGESENLVQTTARSAEDRGTVSSSSADYAEQKHWLHAEFRSGDEDWNCHDTVRPWQLDPAPAVHPKQCRPVAITRSARRFPSNSLICPGTSADT